MQQTRLVEFGKIDQTHDAGYFIRFLDTASAQASFQTYKRRMLELLGLPGPLTILDMGCGTGDDCRQMAALVTGDGRVVGVDNSQAMLAEANRRAAGQNLPVEFRPADALHLPFADNTFDACCADRSPMHVPDPRQAMSELLRITKPQGRVVVYEVDFETLVIDAPDRSLTRRVCHSWCDSFRDGWLGRRMPGLLNELGLREVTVTPHTLVLTPELALLLLGPATVEKAVERGTITAAEKQVWLEQLDRLQREGRFFCTLTGFLVAGTK
jgi:ubiquinone/menaquinone biosynthesis C-methylase UbiE